MHLVTYIDNQTKWKMKYPPDIAMSGDELGYYRFAANYASSSAIETTRHLQLYVSISSQLIARARFNFLYHDYRKLAPLSIGSSQILVKSKTELEMESFTPLQDNGTGIYSSIPDYIGPGTMWPDPEREPFVDETKSQSNRQKSKPEGQRFPRDE